MDATVETVDRSREQSRQNGTAGASGLPDLLEAVIEQTREASPRPLSNTQLRAVVALDRNDGLNLRTLAELLGSTPPLTSRLCDRLEAVGFLERLPNSRDRRELTLRLSERGRGYLRDLRARRRENIQAVLERMTPAGRAALTHGLREYQAAVAAQERAEGPE